MLTMLLAYDAAGNVVATLDYMVTKDADGMVVGLIDFEAHEASGGRLREIWDVKDAVGSATWPEWIGSRAHDFRVELDGKRITTLVHKDSGHRRERAAIEAAVAKRILAAKGAPVDLRDLLGGPSHALDLSEEGKNQPRVRVERYDLPILGMAKRA